jgi:hypothetical protein
MEAGKLYTVTDSKLGAMTKVIVQKTNDSHIKYCVTEVLGRVEKDKIAVTYLEECHSNEKVTFHKVMYRGNSFYIVDCKKYGKLEFVPVSHLSVVATQEK